MMVEPTRTQLVPLQKEPKEFSLNERMAICNSEKGPHTSPGPDYVGTLISDCQPPALGEMHVCYLYASQSTVLCCGSPN